MSKYGTTKAARIMREQDLEKDLLAGLIAHLAANPMPCPFEQADTVRMLVNLDRRIR